jgi:PPP family 3-phenylpropionic acid transporter
MRELRSPYLLLGLTTGVLLPFSTPILADRGFSAAGIGLLLAVTSAAILLAMPPWGHLGDVVLGRRPTLRLAAVLSALAALGLSAPMALPLVGAAFVAWYVLQAAPPVLLDSIAMRELGSERESYGRLRLLLSFSYAVAAFVVGTLYDRVGYGAAYFVFCAATLALVLSLGRSNGRPRGRQPGLRPAGRPPVPPPPGIATNMDGHRRGLRRPGLGSTGAALRTAPSVIGALSAILLASIGLLTASTFLPLRLHDLGATPSIIASSAVVSALFEIPIMLAGRRMVASVGLRGFFVIGCLMYLVATASWIVVDDPVLLVASRAVTGLGYGSFTVASVVALGVMLPSGLQASGQALRQSAISAVAVIAFLFGGLVYNLLGSAAFFALATGGPALGALLGWRFLPRRGASTALGTGSLSGTNIVPVSIDGMPPS